MSNVVVVLLKESALNHPSLCNTMASVKGLGGVDEVGKWDVLLFIITA